MKEVANNQNGRRRAQPGREDWRRLEHLRFQSLLAELSSAIARTSAPDVDREIERWLGEICRALDLDRCAIYERSAPDQEVLVTHRWVRPNFPEFPAEYIPAKYFNATTDYVMAGNVLAFSHSDELPAELADARRFVERWGPKSSLVIPMRFGEVVMGAASFGKFRSHRRWSHELVQRLTLVVQIFGCAIERKVMESRLQQMTSELTTAARRATLGEFAASIAHEVNQPLGAILSHLEGIKYLLARKNADREEISGALVRAIDDVKRASAVVKRIRALFKGGANARDRVDPVSLLEETVTLTRSEASLKGISLRLDLQPGLPAIFGDKVQLQQCVLNLLVNSFDAIVGAASEKREVAIRAEATPSGWVRVLVSDSGPGIDPSLAPRVFDPFVTTKRKGLGIGLVVARAIIEGHGGRIFADSNEHGGASFSIEVPTLRDSNGKRPRLQRRA